MEATSPTVRVRISGFLPLQSGLQVQTVPRGPRKRQGVVRVDRLICAALVSVRRRRPR